MDTTGYLVKASIVYDQDGKKLGLLSWQTDHGLMQELQHHPERVQLLGPRDRLGRTVENAEVPAGDPPNDHTVVIEEPKIGPNGHVVRDARGDPVYVRRTASIDVGHFTVRAGLVWDGKGHYLGTYDQRKELIARHGTNSVTWIGPRPQGAPAESKASAETKHAPAKSVRAGADYILGDAVDDIANNGWHAANTSKMVAGVFTGIYEYAFYLGKGDEERSPFGALYDSATGRHPKPGGLMLLNANGIDANPNAEVARFLDHHYHAIKDGVAGGAKTATTLVVMAATPNPRAGKVIGSFIGAAVGQGAVNLGEGLSEFDRGEKEAGDVAKNVAKAVGKAELTEGVEQLVKLIPTSDPGGLKQRVAAKLAKGLEKLAVNQLDIWTSSRGHHGSGKQSNEHKKQRALAQLSADVEAMVIDIAVEGIPAPVIRGYVSDYGKDIVKGILGGSTKDLIRGNGEA